MNNTVRSLKVDGSGDLIAGGFFTMAGGVSANRVARWDGSSWSALGSGLNASVDSLTVDGSGKLFAGGGFTTVGGTTARFIAGFGEVQNTSIAITDVMPLVSGVPTGFIAEIVSSSAPAGGEVMFTGMPAGQCSDFSLTPLDATTSQATCEVTFNEPGDFSISAEYSGGTTGGAAWASSVSAPIMFSIIRDGIFSDGFEG